MIATILPGYKFIEKIHEGVNTVIYRAIKEPEQTQVIVKTLKAAYPTLEEITRLRHEYKIIQYLNIKGIAKPISLESYNNGLALILEDFGGDSLKNLMNQQKIPVVSSLSIGIQLASILAELHKNHIIHKDIKPHNILIDKETWTINLIDFSIASRLSRETPAIANPSEFEGTLAYMSPEQTGRMNRSIDYRTDFYSLGITLYEILTGKLPFQSSDPMEFVHCHIAKNPIPPHEVNPEIPETVSDIVMKLLAKTAEDRYQSALGLKADLEICCDRLAVGGKIEEFIPGLLDKMGQFLIPQKLYGRQEEVTYLMSAFDRVAGEPEREEKSPTNYPLPITHYQSELMLVSGYSGIGKSALVYEVHKPIVAKRGYFINGKFDQFKRNIPYAALIQAFQDLMRQLLTESNEKIARWKADLLEAFGQNGQLIIEVIPEVEKIVGKQPPVPQLLPSESQNRFNGVFQKFIQVFTQKEHPLVLFLDDLQWADNASLKLIQLLITDADSKYLLLIGAYRDNEVDATHPTIQTIEKIQETGAVVNNIVLRPLDFGNVCELVADTLIDSPAVVRNPVFPKNRVSELAQLLYNKTQGNPFFLTQLLQTLYAENMLTFDYSLGSWQWDIQNILAKGITDYNIVELVARNIQKLPQDAQQVVKLAACIGNRFNLDVLSIAFEKSHSDTAIALWDALQAGLVLPLSNAYKIPLLAMENGQSTQLPITHYQLPLTQVSYKFLHDRVQQAAYSLIPEDEKKQTHLKIGEMLLKNTAAEEVEENIFDIVNQLNIGIEFIDERAKRDELAKLNLIAVKKAKASNAYEAAVRYGNVGLELVATDNWQTQYELTFNLHLETAAAEYLNINFERAKQLSDVVLSHAKTLLEKIPVYETQMQFYIAQNQMVEAINLALPLLKMLGCTLPKKAGKLNILAGLLQTKLNLAQKRIEDLEHLPEMTDPYKLAIVRVLMAVFPAFVWGNPELFPLAVFKIINLCLKYGNTPAVAYMYVMYSVILCGSLLEIESGYRFGQLAVTLIDKFDAKELKPKTKQNFQGGIRIWKEPVRETLASLIDGIPSSLEVGDIESACYHALTYCNSALLSGEPLEFLERKYTNYIEMMVKLKQDFQSTFTTMGKQVVLNLKEGLTSDRDRLIGEAFDEDKMLPILIEQNNYYCVYHIYVYKGFLSYLFKNYLESINIAKLALKYEEFVKGNLACPVQNFYYSLALLAHYTHASKINQKQYLDRVASNQKLMKKWAYHAPSNFQHKYDLVEAEKARVLGQDMKAAPYYDASIKGAKEQGYIQEEALAYELAAEFYFSRGRETIAEAYLAKSYYAYIKWGALAKVKDLEERYPQFFSQMLQRETPSIDLHRTTTTSSTKNYSASLDLDTMMKASQTISGELLIDKLSSKLMQILMENAGARKGLLFLRDRAESGNKVEKWLLAASATLEKDKVVVLPSVPVKLRPDLPITLINYIERTGETVVLNSATTEGLFTNDPYIVTYQPKSILGLPIAYQKKFIGIVYLENNLTTGAFNPQRVEMVKLLASQAAISLENANLYQELQTYSSQLESKNAAIEKAMHELASTQTQLVQSEKMSALGQLIAGVAHEINNPVGCIVGNIPQALDYNSDLLNLLNLYQKKFPNPGPEIEEEIEAIELDFLQEDLPKLLQSLKVSGDRIKEIVLSLRNFARTDETSVQPVNIHEGIDSTLLILNNRLKANANRPAIKIIKEYENLPPVECYPGPLNQVFMNILGNAIDALEDFNKGSKNPNDPSPTIRIRTEVINGDKIAIRISDNGMGMSEKVRAKLFDTFFTTKPVGKGTGLGLSISHSIVVEKHGGKIECISSPGKGAEFAIELPIEQSSQKLAFGNG